MKYMRPTYDLVVRHAVPGETVLVGSSLAFGARVARDERGIPMATVHLSPAIFRTEHDMPKLPGVPVPNWAPRWMKRKFWEAGDRFMIDPVVAPGLNAFRVEKGLKPVKRVLHDWWHSPDLVVGLFPEWFAAPQPDWPPQTRLTGFPLYDERGVEPLPPE